MSPKLLPQPSWLSLYRIILILKNHDCHFCTSVTNKADLPLYEGPIDLMVIIIYINVEESRRPYFCITVTNKADLPLYEGPIDLMVIMVIIKYINVEKPR